MTKVKVLKFFSAALVLSLVSCASVSQKDIDASKDSFYQGNKAFNDKKYQDAVGLYDQAIKSYSGDPEYFLNRGLAYYRMENYDGSIKDFSTAIQKKAEYAEAYYWRALSYYKSKKMNEAIDDFKKAEKMSREAGPKEIHDEAKAVLEKSKIQLLD